MANYFTNFKPITWEKTLFRANEKNSQFAKLTNNDVKIIGGHTAIVNTLSEVIISDYVNGGTLTPQKADTSSITFTLDQQKSFTYEIQLIDGKEIVDEPQVRAKLMQSASYQQRNVEDIYVASFYTGAGITHADLGVAATPIVISLAGTSGVQSPIEYLSEIMLRLDKANVPEVDRRAVFPPEFKKLLVQEMKTVANISGDMVLNTAIVRDLYGIQPLWSNNVHNADGEFDIMACNPEAIAFARSINYISDYSEELGFTKGVKGLTKYGCKVIRPNSLVHGVITFNVPVISE